MISQQHASGRALAGDGVLHQLDERLLGLAPPPAVDAELSKRLDTDRWLDYEQALARLSPEQREAVILRLEFGMGWAEIAAATERASADAARMLVSRALVELARELK